MKATIKQAENNDRNLTISLSGYGHWKISCDYRKKHCLPVFNKVYCLLFFSKINPPFSYLQIPAFVRESY